MVQKSIPQPRLKLPPKVPLVLFMVGICLLISGLILFTSENNTATPQNFTAATAAPETAKPSSNEVADHQVAADLPRIIAIPSNNVNARVMAVGTDKLNRIASPINVHDVGWFNQSSKPGQLGVMVMNGHVSSSSTPGVFYDLKNLKIGDKVYVEQGDGSRHSFLVKEKVTYDYDKVDMLKVLRPINSDKPGLNLITCTGKLIKGSHEFDKRVVIFAEQY